MVPIIDIFAGPGGLGEGFSSSLNENGERVFQIKLSIEKEEHAHRTLQFRAFYRQFSPGTAPPLYYAVLRGESTISNLYESFPEQAAKAKTEAVRATLGEDTWESVSGKIRVALDGQRDWLLIGGPPCQAYSLVGRSRNKNKQGYEPLKDEKHFLYREYLRIIASFWPAVFVMENVKGLLSSRPDPEDDPIFARILEDLEDPGRAEAADGEKPSHRYRLFSLSPRRTTDAPKGGDFLLRAEEHGVPQARHRVIIVGIRDDFTDAIPPALAICPPVPVSSVLKQMPKLRGGLTDAKDSNAAWVSAFTDVANRRWFKVLETRSPEGVYEAAIAASSKMTAPSSGRGGEFIKCPSRIGNRPEWFLDKNLEGVCNHSSRAHITKDLYRYFFAACYASVELTSPRLADFPTDLLPDHKNVPDALTEQKMFLDRFRVQPWEKPSTTVTSHIHKDGHYYIHPDPKQARSLTVREAARLQSFPDNYFFTGPRTAQYIQVGNAVPPLLAYEIARSVATLFEPRGPEG